MQQLIARQRHLARGHLFFDVPQRQRPRLDVEEGPIGEIQIAAAVFGGLVALLIVTSLLIEVLS